MKHGQVIVNCEPVKWVTEEAEDAAGVSNLKLRSRKLHAVATRGREVQ